MKIFKSGKSTVKQPGNSSPSHLTPPLSPPPASPQVSTEWSLGPGETKMAADDAEKKRVKNRVGYHGEFWL